MPYTIYTNSATWTTGNVSIIAQTIDNWIGSALTPVYGSPVTTFTKAPGFSGNQTSYWRSYAIPLTAPQLYLTFGISSNFDGFYNFISTSTTFYIHTGLASVSNPVIVPNLSGTLVTSYVGDARLTEFFCFSNAKSVFLIFRQGGTFSNSLSNEISPKGFFIPDGKPSWWNNSTHPFICLVTFGNNDFNLSTFTGSGLHPFATSGSPSAFYAGRSQSVNPDGSRDIISGVPILSPNSQGIYGNLIEDIGFTTPTGMSIYSELTAGATRWRAICLNPGGSRGIVLRTQ